jgi:predicted DNA-binding transcriptional regulator YafY
MSTRETITSYNLIIKKLRKAPATFEEILEYLRIESEIQQYDFTISLRTFQRYLNEIRSLFNIDIRNDKSIKAYRIFENEGFDMSQLLMETFDLFNALNITDRFSSQIHFEERKPQGTEHLYGLLHAIKNRLSVEFSYQKYWENNANKRTVEPYALKEFKNRWYVFVKDTKDGNFKSFGLDRMTDLQISRQHFQPDNTFDIDEYFKHCFGITGPNDFKLEEVILSFTPFQGKYIKSLPLHKTQQVIIDNDEEMRISLRIYLSHDFFMELLSFGANVKVVQPESLAKKIKEALKANLEQYE